MNKLACIAIILIGLITLILHLGMFTFLTEPQFDDSHIKEIENSKGPIGRVCSFSEVYAGGKISNWMIFYLISSTLLIIFGTVSLAVVVLRKFKPEEKRTMNSEL